MSELINIKVGDLIEIGLCISDCELDEEETIKYIYETLEEIKLKSN